MRHKRLNCFCRRAVRQEKPTQASPGLPERTSETDLGRTHPGDPQTGNARCHRKRFGGRSYAYGSRKFRGIEEQARKRLRWLDAATSLTDLGAIRATGWRR